MTDPTATPLSAVQNKRVVIVGAGQAGLAMGAALAAQGLIPQQDFVIIDAAESADFRAWRRRWHSLKLFTSARNSALPHFPFPGDPKRYPRTDEVASYLDEYESQMGLRPYWGIRVLRVVPQQHGRGLTLDTNIGTISTRNVVAATGPFALPRYPPIATAAQGGRHDMHSDEYTHPRQLSAGPVLIVGGGNTGRQLALELSHTHDVTLSIGNPLKVLPQKIAGIDIFTWLRKSGLLRVRASSPLGRRLARSEFAVGIDLDDLRNEGVSIVDRIERADENWLTTRAGIQIAPRSVIWATGYYPGTGWLPNKLAQPDGTISHRKGRTAIPGLFVLGLPWLTNRASALITGVGHDAPRIARWIRRRP